MSRCDGFHVGVDATCSLFTHCPLNCSRGLTCLEKSEAMGSRRIRLMSNPSKSFLSSATSRCLEDEKIEGIHIEISHPRREPHYTTYATLSPHCKALAISSNCFLTF
jgi:hypothetical protein